MSGTVRPPREATPVCYSFSVSHIQQVIICTHVSYLSVKQVKETFIWATLTGNILTLKEKPNSLESDKLPPLKMPSQVLMHAGLIKQFKIKEVLLLG